MLRVQQIALAIARQLGLSQTELEIVGQAALFHDIGKLAIPDSILLKPASLTPEEGEVQADQLDYRIRVWDASAKRYVAKNLFSGGTRDQCSLALRLGVHGLVRARTTLVPTVLLDDVFSELDPARSRALVAELPTGQSLLTTAAPLPEGIEVARLLPVESLEVA